MLLTLIIPITFSDQYFQVALSIVSTEGISTCYTILYFHNVSSTATHMACRVCITGASALYKTHAEIQKKTRQLTSKI